MNRLHYIHRCLCKEEFSITKKSKLTKRSEGRPFHYPRVETNETSGQTKTFQIKYEKKFSLIGKNVLNSFQNKYIYYAIDDIFDMLKENPEEQVNLLEILYSPILFLQNNFSINFFDIWIQEVYIEETSEVNKFLKNDFQTSKTISYITLKFVYKKGVPVKKLEPLW
jgi:hypothetical protein